MRSCSSWGRLKGARRRLLRERTSRPLWHIWSTFPGWDCKHIVQCSKVHSTLLSQSSDDSSVHMLSILLVAFHSHNIMLQKIGNEFLYWLVRIYQKEHKVTNRGMKKTSVFSVPRALTTVRYHCSRPCPDILPTRYLEPVRAALLNYLWSVKRFNKRKIGGVWTFSLVIFKTYTKKYYDSVL